MRVLIGEDSLLLREGIARLIEAAGMEVVAQASDLDDVLRKARAHRPEVAVLDIGLPGMDGYELARRLRQQPGMEQALLIAVTGYGQDSDRERTRAAGFDHHLVKPVDPEYLLRLLAG